MHCDVWNCCVGGLCQLIYPSVFMLHGHKTNIYRRIYVSTTGVSCLHCLRYKGTISYLWQHVDFSHISIKLLVLFCGFSKEFGVGYLMQIENMMTCTLNFLYYLIINASYSFLWGISLMNMSSLAETSTKPSWWLQHRIITLEKSKASVSSV